MIFLSCVSPLRRFVRKQSHISQEFLQRTKDPQTLTDCETQNQWLNYLQAIYNPDMPFARSQTNLDPPVSPCHSFSSRPHSSLPFLRRVHSCWQEPTTTSTLAITFAIRQPSSNCYPAAFMFHNHIILVIRTPNTQVALFL